MRQPELELAARELCDLRGKRVLIFVVAYNAATTIETVLRRIPVSLQQPNVEVLVIDDSSKDQTFARGLCFQQESASFKVTILRTPTNQGYGGNQKLGYRYAIDNGFDIVALVHGDGQYAPEKLPELLQPLVRQETDAVFGSRMINKSAARAGGMPGYKWIGNQILTSFQNCLLGTKLSEFHTGYRLYSTAALAQVPFDKNTNDFHFDTEIIIQFILKKLRIAELAIPTFYGDEVCHVNGLKYAWDVCKGTVKARFCGIHLFYDRKFDVNPSEVIENDKLGFASSESIAARTCSVGRSVLQLGTGRHELTTELRRKLCSVTDLGFPYEASTVTTSKLPPFIRGYDYILLLDLIENVQDPEGFVDDLRRRMEGSQPEIIVSTANVAFFVTRLMLLFGQFNYSKKGILGLNHRRLFTFRSLRALLEQAGYEVLEEIGVPAPFPLALGLNRWSKILLSVNQWLIWLSRTLFSYQLCLRARPLPDAAYLLKETIESSADLRAEVLVRAA